MSAAAPTARALELLETLPTFLHDAPEIVGTLDALAREVERIDAQMAIQLRNQFASTASEYLHWWERLLGLSVNPPDKTLEQRKASVLAFVGAIKNRGTGANWKEALTRLIGTNWEYEEHNPGAPGTPPPYTIRITLPFSPGIVSPNQPTATVNPPDSGPVAHYAVTAINEYGETEPSDVLASRQGTTNTTLDWNDVTGATGYRVYRGATPTTLRRIAEVVPSTFVDANTVATEQPPPAGNTTRPAQSYEAEVLARAITPAHIDLIVNYDVGFLVGISQVGEEAL